MSDDEEWDDTVPQLRNGGQNEAQSIDGVNNGSHHPNRSGSFILSTVDSISSLGAAAGALTPTTVLVPHRRSITSSSSSSFHWLSSAAAIATNNDDDHHHDVAQSHGDSNSGSAKRQSLTERRRSSDAGSVEESRRSFLVSEILNQDSLLDLNLSTKGSDSGRNEDDDKEHDSLATRTKMGNKNKDSKNEEGKKESDGDTPKQSSLYDQPMASIFEVFRLVGIKVAKGGKLLPVVVVVLVLVILFVSY